jgi:hypothetical protein
MVILFATSSTNFHKIQNISTFRKVLPDTNQTLFLPVLVISLTSLLNTCFCHWGVLGFQTEIRQLNLPRKQKFVHITSYQQSLRQQPLSIYSMDGLENEADLRDLKKLPAHDLRQRRLAALGILLPQNLVYSSEIKYTSDKPDTSLASRIDNTHEIIDLLDSDNEDDNNEVTQAGLRCNNSPPTASKRSFSAMDDVDKNAIKSESKPLYCHRLDTFISEPKEKTKMTNKDIERKHHRGDLEIGLHSRLDTMKQSEQDKILRGNTHGREWKFKVATWNVWFGPQGDGQPHPGPRMRAIVRLLKEQNNAEVPLLFIGLQEVIDPLAHFLIPALESAGYYIYRQEGAAYGCAVAVHKRLEIVSKSWNPYSNTVMMRGYYQVRAKLPSKVAPNDCPEVVFTTTHLESFTGSDYTGSKERPQQMLEVENFCNRQVLSKSNPASMAIITGDLNWDDEGMRRKTLDPVMANIFHAKGQWHDSWLETASKKSGPSKTKTIESYTYDAKLNPMLGGNLRRRFDRCLVRSSGGSTDEMARRTNKDGSLWVAKTTDTILVGHDALQDLTWDKKNFYNGSIKETQTAPSDHFGLVATITLSEQISPSS